MQPQGVGKLEVTDPQTDRLAQQDQANLQCTAFFGTAFSKLVSLSERKDEILRANKGKPFKEEVNFSKLLKKIEDQIKLVRKSQFVGPNAPLLLEKYAEMAILKIRRNIQRSEKNEDEDICQMNEKKDLKNETGVMKSPDQQYEGEWLNGIRNGYGQYKNKISNEFYIGEFREGRKEGQGCIVYADGSSYAGQFKNNLPHGIGELEYINKDKYLGNFIEGSREGKGRYFYSEGTVFTGIWIDNNISQGELILFNGDKFQGTFKDNERLEGVYWYRNGDQYKGSWKNNVKHGFGRLRFQNGQLYEGQFVEGHKHGEGKYRWENGDVFTGQFKYDKRQGLGIYVWADSSVYKGEWHGDRMNGIGRLIKDGYDLIGLFRAGHFDREVSVQREELNRELREYLLELN